MIATALTSRDGEVTRAVRAWVLGIGIGTLALGLWASVAPGSFFDDFPFPGANWVSTLGGFNEHLTRDFGSAEAGLAVAAVLAAARSSRSGIRAVMWGFAVFGLLHLAYHLATFDAFAAGSAISQGISLVAFVAVPGWVLVATSHRHEKGNSG